MTSRFRLAAVVASLLSATGCGVVLNPASLVQYSRVEDLDKFLGDKPNLRSKVIGEVDGKFGESPLKIRVPQGAGLRDGGLHLAAFAVPPDQDGATPERVQFPGAAAERGGYALYRQHCLSCHGISGDGDGPTAPFLIPRPRDFRKGVFKFTSTGAKPTREDLRRTIVQGLDGTSMPSFDALASTNDIEQIIDYVMFLAMRGEFETRLVQESKELDDSDPSALEDDIIQEDLELIFLTWKDAEGRVAAPEAPRTPSSAESVQRGKNLFLGRTKENLQCAGCHGDKAHGDGLSWIDPKTFEQIVFGRDTSRERYKELAEIAQSKQKKWSDDWGDPIRPADLARKNAMYKGGRRPIDLYWRIRNGIGQEIMPAHSNLTTPQIWDLVNFVMALPYQPELLDDATTPSAAAMNRP